MIQRNFQIHFPSKFIFTYQKEKSITFKLAVVTDLITVAFYVKFKGIFILMGKIFKD